MSLLSRLHAVAGKEEAEKVVTLDTVAKNPFVVDTLDLAAMRDLMVQLERASGAIRTRWFVVSTDAVLAQPKAPEFVPDKMLTVDEAAMRIGIARDTLYRNADDYPFTRRPRPRSLRFSERGIEEWLTKQREKRG